MTQILNIHGKPADRPETDVKKAHDPEELAREKVRMQNLFTQIYKDFLRDLNPAVNDQPSPVRPNRPALREHYGNRWKEQAEALNKSSFPHKVDPDEMFRAIDMQYSQIDQQADAQRPLHEVEDMAQYDLPRVMELPAGNLHMNTCVALVVNPAGFVRVYVRHVGESDKDWLRGWKNGRERAPLVETTNYTLGELFTLLRSIRINGLSALTTRQMSDIR